MMRDAMHNSMPVELGYGDWHLPYVSIEELQLMGSTLGFEGLIKVSVARCARVSYLTHDGKRDPAADLALYTRLASAGHMSPLEHAARPAHDLDVDESPDHSPPNEQFFGNFRGWVQHRKLIEGEAVFRG
jgi:hypothetical protein